VKEYLPIIIGTIVVGVVFALLWWSGNLKRLAAYIQETREELRKCTWPSRDELKGSTLVVMISIIVLSAYIVGADFLIALVVRWVTKG
jgi:preprotein translocase SecE subunit